MDKMSRERPTKIGSWDLGYLEKGRDSSPRRTDGVEVWPNASTWTRLNQRQGQLSDAVGLINTIGCLFTHAHTHTRLFKVF